MKLTISTIFIFLFTASMGIARDYIIYSIAQDLPMGEDNEVIRKNYYINMGNKQGLEKGTVLDIYRRITRLDPYKNRSQYNYDVKIGEVKVLHAQENSSIGRMVKLNNDEETPLFEIDNLMIGDKVEINTEN